MEDITVKNKKGKDVEEGSLLWLLIIEYNNNSIRVLCMLLFMSRAYTYCK